MIDAESIKAQINIQDVVRADLGEPDSRSGNVEYWVCPFHADNDASLAAYDEGGWKCYGCGKTGDVITWVMERQGVDFRRACEFLTDGDLERFSTGERVERKPRPVTQAPTGDWQTAAQTFILRAEETLWSEVGAKARRYLELERGLTEETMRRWRLGYNGAEGFCRTGDVGHGRRQAQGDLVAAGGGDSALPVG